MSLFGQLEQRRVDLETTAENSARPARLTMTFRTSGHGELRIKRPVLFGLTFIEPPHVSTGVVLAAGRLVPTKFPNACAGVYRWVKNERGFFVGAKMFFVVDSGEQPYELNHHVTFEATAIKYMPEGM